MTFEPRSAHGEVAQFLYEAADRLWPVGVPRTINGERMRLSIRAARFYRRRYEPDKASFLRLHCRRGTTTVDIGANFGVFTVIMARAVGEGGRVLALEPTPSTCSALRRTVTQNGCERIVEVHQAAASSTAGAGVLHLSRHRGDMANSLVSHHSRAAGELSVRLVTVDDVLEGDDVSCLKIDAEGSELDILIGSELTLARCRPAVAVEVHPWLLAPDRRLALWELFERSDYGTWLNGRRLERDTFLVQEHPFEIQALASKRPGTA